MVVDVTHVIRPVEPAGQFQGAPSGQQRQAPSQAAQQVPTQQQRQAPQQPTHGAQPPRKGGPNLALVIGIVAAAAVIIALIVVFVVVKPFGQSGGDGASSAASASASSASAEGTSGSAEASSSAASEGSSKQSPSVAYMEKKTVVTTREGKKTTKTYEYDEKGRPLSETMDYASGATGELFFTNWDEDGYPTVYRRVDESADGKTSTTTAEVTILSKYDDGSVREMEIVFKDKADEGAYDKYTYTYEHEGDVEVFHKQVVKAESFDKSGKVIKTTTETTEFDEDGLQTGYELVSVSDDGSKKSTTATVTWKKDADGKPTSFEAVVNEDGKKSTRTGDVEVDGYGMISEIENVEIDGKASPLSMTVERVEVENPLPVSYQLWKNFALDLVI